MFRILRTAYPVDWIEIKPLVSLTLCSDYSIYNEHYSHQSFQFFKVALEILGRICYHYI